MWLRSRPFVYGGTLMSMLPNEWYDAFRYGISWVWVVLLPMLPSIWKSWNVLLSPTTFIHNFKNQIILHINIDFHYKAMYDNHQLVSLLFSLHHCMSLNQNDNWCQFASLSRWLLIHWIFFLPMTWFLYTEITLAIKTFPPPPKTK